MPHDLVKIKRELAQLATLYISDPAFPKPPVNFTLHLGLYRGFGEEGLLNFNYDPNYPPIGSDDTRARRIGYQIKHRLLYTHACPYSTTPGNLYVDASAVTLNDSTKKMNVAGMQDYYITKLTKRTDFVHDTLEMMKRNMIPFAEAVDKLRPAVRRKYFGKSIKTDVPKEFKDYSQYEKIVRNLGTYYGVDYYPKYINPEKKFEETEHLTDVFLKHNLKEQVLKRSSYYLVIKSPDNHTATILLPGGKDPFKSFRIIRHLHAGMPEFSDKTQVIFCYAIEGTDLMETEPVVDPDRAVEMYAWQVNPIQEVTNYVGAQYVDYHFRVNNINMQSEEDWFFEFVRLHFPNLFSYYNTDGMDGVGSGALPMPGNKAVFDDALRTLSGEIGGPIKDQIESIRKELDADPKLFVFFQGFPVGNNYILIGSLAGVTYMRHRETGTIRAYEDYKFILNFRLIVIFKEVYRRTKDIIPIYMAVLGVATAVMSGGVLGAQGFVVRQLGQEILGDIGMSIVKKRIMKEIKEKIFLASLYGIFRLLPSTTIKPFLLGVIKGYCYGSLSTMLDKYTLLFTQGPRYVRWYKTIRSIYDKGMDILNLIARYKKIIDDTTALRIEAQFTAGVKKINEAILQLAPNIFYIEYEDADFFIQLAADVSNKKVMTKAEWETQRYVYFKQLLYQQGDLLRTEIEVYLSEEDIEQFLKDNKVYIYAGMAAAGTLMLTYIGGKGFLPALGLTLAILGGADIAANDANIIKGLKDLALKPIDKWDTYSDEEKEKFGEFVGHLIGGFVFDRKAFGKGSLFLDIKRRTQAKLKPGVSTQVASHLFFTHLEYELKHGLLVPLIKLIIAHHLLVFERYKKLTRRSYETVINKVHQKINKDPFKAELFTSEERKLSMNDIKEVLIIYIDEVKQALKELTVAETHAQYIRLRDLLALDYSQKIRIPSIRDLLDGNHPADWPVNGQIYVQLSCLQKSLNSMLDAVEMLTEPMQPLPFALIDLLNIADLEVAALGSGNDSLKNFYPKTA